MFCGCSGAWGCFISSLVPSLCLWLKWRMVGRKSVVQREMPGMPGFPLSDAPGDDFFLPLSSLIFGKCSFATYSAGGVSFSFLRTRRRPPSPIDLGRSLYCVQEVIPDYKRFLWGLCIALLRPFSLALSFVHTHCRMDQMHLCSFQQQRSLKLFCTFLLLCVGKVCVAAVFRSSSFGKFVVW